MERKITRFAQSLDSCTEKWPIRSVFTDHRGQYTPLSKGTRHQEKRWNCVSYILIPTLKVLESTSISKANKTRDLPRQRPLVQLAVSMSLPLQCMPPFTGAGLSHRRRRWCWQSASHVDHDDHVDHSPFTGNVQQFMVLNWSRIAILTVYWANELQRYYAL